MSESKSSIGPQNVSRAELLWLVAAILFGSFLRLWFPGRMAVEHFDEGVYASNFWFGAGPDNAYPMQHLYAPPLLPKAIEWTMTIVSLLGFEPTGFVPMIPSLIAGIATIPSIWWIARHWFGPLAGLVSAWFVSTSDFHACYSRAALTDVPVCLFILWAVYFISQSFAAIARTKPVTVERGKKKTIVAPVTPWREIALAGLFTGIAWWTKYNGWLPLAIGLAGGGLWQLLIPAADRQIVRLTRCWLLIALIAFLIWSPVLWELQSDGKGGYASVAANHRNYVVGLRGWPQSALRQIQVVGMYDNLLGMFAEPFVKPNPIDQFRMMNAAERARFRAAQLANPRGVFGWRFPDFVPEIIYWQSFFVPLGLLVIAGISFFWKPPVGSNPYSRISRCLIFAWLCGMTVTTPLYHPYPRLVFPWLFSVWLSVASLLQLLVDRNASLQSAGRRLGGIGIVVMIWLVSNSSIRVLCETAHAFRDRTEMQLASKAFADVLAKKLDVAETSKKEAIAYVWGEPAVVFGLRANRVEYVGPVQGLRPPQLLTGYRSFVVFGKQAFESPQFEENRGALKDFDFCKIERVASSHLVRMDSFHGTRDEFDQFRRPPEKPAGPRNIFRIRPDAEMWMYEILR